MNLLLPSKRAVIVQLSLALFLPAFASSVSAQCPTPRALARSSSDANGANSEPLLPESGLLTNDSYTNPYFGFTLPLPIPLSGHRLMVPITLPGEHALLAIGFQDGSRYGTLKVTAGGKREENSKAMTSEEAQQREDDIARSKGDATAMRRLDYTPPSFKLKRVDRQAGEVRGTQYTTRIRAYTVRFTIQTNDQAFLKKARTSVTSLRVFCTDDAGRFYTKDGKAFAPQGTPTTGPTIPTSVVDEAIRSRPAEHAIPEGTLAGSTFQVPELEFSYVLPAGWSAMPTPPDLIDVDARNEEDRRLSYVWKACARTLFQAGRGNDTVTLRVLDQSSLALPFPASTSDTLHAESLGEYLQMLGKFGKIKSSRLVEPGDRLFVVYEGTVDTGVAADNLENRQVQAIAVTRYNKLIFAWTWSAPTHSDLAQVPASDAHFGSSRPIAVGPTTVTSRSSSRP